MIIANTQFKKRRLATWTSPNEKTKNQIDFILINKRNKELVTNCSTLSTPDVSDHKLIRMKFKTNFQKFRKSIDKSCKLDYLNDPIVREDYEIKLNNRFDKLNELQDPEELLTLIETSINNTILQVEPKNNVTKPEWISEQSKKAIEEKKNIRKEKGEKCTEYKIIKAEVKKLIKKDKMKQIEDQCNDLNKLPPNQRYYQIIKKLRNNYPKQFGWGIKRQDGTITYNKEEILQEWEKFYENLYYDEPNNNEIITDEELNLPPFTLEEVKHAIKQLKCGKAPGIDKIHAEMLKAGGDSIAKALLKLFNRILETNKIPENFKKAEIILIHKKGDRNECKNYRPISLLNHTYKTFTLTLANRIKNELYSFLPKSQAAYQPGRTTIEQIICIEQIIEKAIEFNKPLYAIFIDFTKAFDSVKLPSLWQALDKSTINKKYIQLLRNTYVGSKSRIKTDIGTTRFINILKGVKQGDVLSAVLFCVILAAILIEVEHDTGYNIGGHLISNLGYADDMALLNENPKKLQIFLNAFCETAEKSGLKINIEKTNAFTTAKDEPNIQINGRQIKYIDNFTYLGHNINNKNDHQTALDARIAKGWIAVNKNKALLNSPRLSIKTKVKVYQTYIVPVLLYGCECITWSKKLLKQIEIFQNKIMRLITGVKLQDHVTITSLRSRTKIPSIEREIKERKLRLFGHLKRQETGLVKMCIEGMVNGKRKIGRPQRRWRDDIPEWTGKNWNTINSLTRDRRKWKGLVKAQSAKSGKCG